LLADVMRLGDHKIPPDALAGMIGQVLQVKKRERARESRAEKTGREGGVGGVGRLERATRKQRKNQSIELEQGSARDTAHAASGRFAVASARGRIAWHTPNALTCAHAHLLVERKRCIQRAPSRGRPLDAAPLHSQREFT
jgi:hypothetical protein